jgi:truncated hemoglobin YjbI
MTLFPNRLSNRVFQGIPKLITLVLAFVMVNVFLINAGEARPRHRSKKKKNAAAIINEKALYDRIGGAKVTNEVVDEWLKLSFIDSRLATQFGQFSTVFAPGISAASSATGAASGSSSKNAAALKLDRVMRLKAQLIDQICEIADGPCHYKGRSMAKAHIGMNLTESDFVAFSENLYVTLQKHNIPEREKNELLGRIGALRAEMNLGEARK